ncbi:MAG: protease HtpX [Xanthomonadales bacterium]|nr:protease HtpX [Xanthomonadales bacterium]
MLRIGLFLATNLAVLLLLSLIAKLTGLDLYAARSGTDLGSLLIFAAIIGFAGSFISLAMSKWLAKRSTGAHVIEQPRNEMEAWLVNTVRRQADAAGIGMPEVAVYDAPDINAFATGMSRNNALVAVSTGLLRNMNRDEAEAVLAHEVSHVANGDMVTMALIQGVLNTFVIFLSRVIGRIIDQAVFKSERPGIGYYAIVFVLEIVLGLLASIIAMWFSRWREFRADAGGGRLAGRHKMIAALQRLQANHGPAELPQEVAAFGISGGVAQGLKKLFMSHPPLSERIAALQKAE